MAIRYSESVRDDRIGIVLTAMDAGSGAGTIKVYTGTQPADADVAISTETLLATFTCTDPAFTGPADGVITLDAAPDLSATAAATGTAGWARAADSDGNTVFDGSVGTTGTDFIISSTSITSGQTVTLTAGTLTDAAS